MTNKHLTDKKKHRWFRDDTADEHDEAEPKIITVKQEVRHLRRVAKRGEKALRHMSDSFKEEVTEKGLEITREILESVAKSPGPPPPAEKTPAVPAFSCLKCAAKIPKDSVRCPECDVLYVQDPKGIAVDESVVRAEEIALPDDGKGIVDSDTTAFAHFDTSSGVLTCLQSDDIEADFGLECRNCNTVTQFGTDRCPICGHDFDEWDTGLVSLLDGLKFDLDDDRELDCPSCGEHVLAENGMCPSCKEIIRSSNLRSTDARVLPIFQEKDLVFVHLDVANGDFWFARKLKGRKIADTQSVHLDSIGKGGFNQDWKSLARI